MWNQPKKGYEGSIVCRIAGKSSAIPSLAYSFPGFLGSNQFKSKIQFVNPNLCFPDQKSSKTD